jgi:hypothetical protein
MNVFFLQLVFSFAVARVAQFACLRDYVSFYAGSVGIMTDQALSHVDGDVCCALAVFLDFGFVTGVAQVGIQLCQQGIVVCRMWVVTSNTVAFAYGSVNILLFEFFCFLLMALKAECLAAFYQ